MSYGAGHEIQRLVFDRLFDLAEGPTARVELCRVVAGGPVGEVVAVKRLKPEIAEQPQFVDMFRDEMWMASSLRHPNVAQVVGWGEDDQGLYLAVEFVRGVSLTRLMRNVFSTGEEFTERLVVYLAACVCGGLAAAHELRGPGGDYLDVVHRDLTPGNILLGFDGTVKITDFGLAKAKQRITHTAIGITKGEPAYMSPEQVTGLRLDGRSDLFALGVVLFEVLAKQRPWNIRGVADALSYIVGTQHPDLGGLCPRVDRAVIALVDRCLAKDPAQRWSNSRELKAQFDHWLHLHGYTDSQDSLGRFVRRNALRQMRWLERALAATAPASQPLPLDKRHRADSRTRGGYDRRASPDQSGGYAAQPGPDQSGGHPAQPESDGEDMESTRAESRRDNSAAALRPDEPTSGTATTEPTRFLRARPPSTRSTTARRPEPLQPPSEHADEDVEDEGFHDAPTTSEANDRYAFAIPRPQPVAIGQRGDDTRLSEGSDFAIPVPLPVPQRLYNESSAPAERPPAPAPRAPQALPTPQSADANEPAQRPNPAADRRGSVIDQIQAGVMQLAIQAEDLAGAARAASAHAYAAAERARQAAEHAEQQARRLDISARAVQHAGEALQLAQSGDQHGALDKLRAAHELQRQATKG